MKTILFQGDSITDAGRDYNDDSRRGLGYPHLVTALLAYENPGEYNLINRGISGNRIVDVYARIKKDIINLKPDVMSVLIGINDVWHELNYVNGVDTPKFEKIYTMLIEEVLEAVPTCKIMILEPFVLHGTATDDKWDEFYTGTIERAQACKRIAEKFGLPFITLQDKFDAACEKEAPAYWLWDGVHPTAAGHEIIKREWLAAYEKLNG